MAERVLVTVLYPQGWRIEFDIDETAQHMHPVLDALAEHAYTKRLYDTRGQEITPT